MLKASRNAWASFLHENTKYLILVLMISLYQHWRNLAEKTTELAVIRRNQPSQVCINDSVENNYINGMQNLTKIIPGDTCAFNLMYEISPNIWWYNVR